MKRLIFVLAALMVALGFSRLPVMASLEDQVAMNISPISVDFGTILPGRAVTGSDLTIENTGNVTIEVTAEIIDDSGFYGSYLKLNNTPSTGGDWTAADLGLDSFAADAPARTVTTKLDGVPSNLNPSSYTCTIIFWAEEQ